MQYPSTIRDSCWGLANPWRRRETVFPTEDNLCLESTQLYAKLKVGDTLAVEGKANWIGLLIGLRGDIARQISSSHISVAVSDHANRNIQEEVNNANS